MIKFQTLNVFKKHYYGLSANFNSFFDKYRFLKLRRINLISESLSDDYNRQISYKYKWLSLEQQKFLGYWQSVTDQINGGQSKAQIFFNKQKKIISYKGYVQTKDKDRMINYPFINMQKRNKFFFNIGPLKLLQIEARTDGKPLQVHLSLNSFIKGAVNIYGFILSKSTQWQTYQLPIQNMILRGTQQDYHEGFHNTQRDVLSRIQHSSIFDKQFQSTKKIINTQLSSANQIQVGDIGFRLVSTSSEHRQIEIRSINFAYKKGYEKFIKYYKNPYFYLTQNQQDQQIKRKENIKLQGLNFLKNNLQNIDYIDTGDIKYYTKNTNNNKKVKV